MCAQNFVDEILLPHLRDQDDSDAGSSANESFFPSARIRCEYAVIPNEERYLPNADRSHFVPSVIRAPLGRSFAPLRMTPTSGQPMPPGFAKATARPANHLYLTEQPYGFVLDVLTVLPAIDSSRATFT